MDEAFKFLLGVNYWPRLYNVKMWKEWDEESLKKDIEKMKELGVRVVRIFLRDIDFADERGIPIEESLQKLQRFLDLLHEKNLQAFVTLLVGHMSGKNFPIPWTSFDSLYTPSSVEKTATFARKIAERLASHPALAGWILSNELSLVKRATTREDALRLLEAFTKTMKSVDPNHIVSSGDIPDSFMQETPNVRHLVDYVGPHLYLYDTDLVRLGYFYGAMLELFSNAGDLPVILEEFGFSTLQFSEESHARFVEEILYTSLAHEASGAFIWCFSDFTEESGEPYDWRPLELGFGLLKKDGSEKLAADSYRNFSHVVERIEKLGLHSKYKRLSSTFVVYPFYLFRDYEFIWYKESLGFWESIKPHLMSYSLLSASSVPSRMVYELDLKKILKSAKLVVLPSVVATLASTWRNLLEYVELGGTLYSSVIRGAGAFKALHDAPTHLWNELFGVENVLEAGSMGRKIFGVVKLKFVRKFGNLSEGDELLLKVPESIYTFKAQSTDSDVIALDDEGEPVIFFSRRGRGKTILSLIPIEVILQAQENAQWHEGTIFYEQLAFVSEVERRYASKDPRVELQVYTGEKDDLLIVINHSNENVETSITSATRIVEAQVIGGKARLLPESKREMRAVFPPKSGSIIRVVKT
ncbi:Glycoside hydrolase, family 42, N-terminal domain protein [Thermofilum pendens Hrk 5]|uniref:Glycoside hydrolase, family 42, N-terminal domain protein n=1 Tax=Thermofilum pendens (strain DSM 2475 / Hrk 5) TaxID=368408 RepID=A1S0T7_THEPD|nr:Glycoside hydrolase, family 42, N-terminal domain protein [Thermofilum pendens Hrk 5]